MTHTTILFYKPFQVLSQFTDEGSGKRTLSDFGPFSKSVYPVGRLDYDSEGLLLLTDDNRLKHRLLDPTFAHTRTYLVQVERIPETHALEQLENGVVIEGKQTRKAPLARLLQAEPDLPERVPPVRFRKTVPTAWIELTLTEGRNRQVRKMTAAVGHPTLRLVRTKIGALTLGGLSPGAHRVLTQREIEMLLASHSV
ncbi:MAG TPA: pseudouridine synthase [Bacteroidota bacterium]|nr:pseudouridine synthase [Bacteroidota bacterium]